RKYTYHPYTSRVFNSERSAAELPPIEKKNIIAVDSATFSAPCAFSLKRRTSESIQEKAHL
ncbi:hypothetical protein, partial [Gordonibacter sp.]|uniref:hypothetical protein n=1 Tax=Gordonibacter sp. TaxID=1968902 RepID=UPI002FC58AFE